MSGLDVAQLKYLVVEPALSTVALMSTAAMNLVTGTALCETGGVYLHQLSGPALGLWQMEEATEQDTWANFLAYEHDLAIRVRSLLAPGPTFTQLLTNMSYGAAMCRIKYRRSPDPLPDAKDAAGMAGMWKRVYNSRLGAGEADKAHVALFEQAIGA